MLMGHDLEISGNLVLAEEWGSIKSISLYRVESAANALDFASESDLPWAFFRAN